MKQTFAQYAARLNAEERYRLEERAGIMEFQGNMTRELAERMAMEDHREQSHKNLIAGFDHLLSQSRRR